jgi:hypothetical protein
MYKIIYIVITFFYCSVSFSQNTIQPYIKVKKISFFDSKLKNLMLENLSSFKIKITKYNNLTTYDDFNGNYYELNNNYAYIKRKVDGLIINRANPTPKIYESKLVPQLLNDTLLLAFDGRIMNLNTGKPLSTNIGQNNIAIEIKNPKQIECYGSVLKTDIIMEHFNGPSNFFYNLLSDGLIREREINAFSGTILNNSKSKYLMFTQDLHEKGNSSFCLMNRYNVNDTISVFPRFKVNEAEGEAASKGQRPPIIYNDSILYCSVSINESYKFLNFGYNQELNVEMSEKNFFRSNSEYYFQKLKAGGQFNYSYDEVLDAVATCYFYKKYNKLDLSMRNYEGFTNCFKTYKNLLGYEPYIIVEYNFRDKKIKSILDKAILPLTQISALYLDNNNKFLIAKQPNNKFTIFNLKTKKEIITLEGRINGINDKNELMINVIGARKNTYDVAYPSSIELIKLDLNELDKVSEKYYVPEFDSSLNIDEFTTKEVFNSIIKSQIDKQNLSTATKIEDPSKITSEYKNTHSLYSNEYVNSFLNKTINNYYNILNSVDNKELIYKIKYLSYSMENKSVEFMTEELKNNELDLLSNFSTNNFDIHDQRYNGKNYSIITFLNMSIEEAKKLKDGSCFIIVKNKKSDKFKIPNITNLFVFRFYDILNRNLYENVGEGGQQKSKEFYNSYVPINSELSNYYNSWYLRLNNQETLLYQKKYSE